MQSAETLNKTEIGDSSLRRANAAYCVSSSLALVLLRSLKKQGLGVHEEGGKGPAVRRHGYFLTGVTYDLGRASLQLFAGQSCQGTSHQPLYPPIPS